VSGLDRHHRADSGTEMENNVKHERPTEEIRETAALYSLGNLTQHEARSFELHVQEGCTVCETELKRFRSAASTLGLAAEETTPPEYIRDLLFARVEREPRTVPEDGTITAASGKSGAATAPPQLFSHAGREKRGSMPWLLALLAVGLLILLGTYTWNHFRNETDRLQAGISAARNEANSLKEQLDEARSGDLERIMSVITDPGIMIIHLKGQPASPSSSGTIIWDVRQQRCLLLGSFIPLPQGKRYQLWFSTADRRVSIGLLDTDADGHILTTLPVPEVGGDVTSVVVTLEPYNGSPSPSGPSYAAGRFH
jgi:anti-sigma-K factor RskA